MQPVLGARASDPWKAYIDEPYQSPSFKPCTFAEVERRQDRGKIQASNSSLWFAADCRHKLHSSQTNVPYFLPFQHLNNQSMKVNLFPGAFLKNEGWRNLLGAAVEHNLQLLRPDLTMWLAFLPHHIYGFWDYIHRSRNRYDPSDVIVP